MKTFSTVRAAEIVRMDRQRLNEDIASGIYPCAPATRAGKGRVWDENDLIALRLYGFLSNAFAAQSGPDRKRQTLKHVAGVFAHHLLEALRSEVAPDARLDFPIDGFNDQWVERKDSDPPSFWGDQTGSEIATMCISLAGLRKQVAGRIAEIETQTTK